MRQFSFTTLAAIAAALIICACDNPHGGPSTGIQSPAPHGAQGGTLTVNADASGAGHSVTFVFNGSSAFSAPCTFDGTSLTCIYLWVSQGGTPSAPLTFLYYDVYGCSFDPVSYWYTCQDSQVGFGQIPNSDFGGGTGQERLHTNTAGNASFYTWVGAPGVIDVTWRKSNLFANSNQGTSSSTWATFSLHSDSQGDNASAVAVGSLIGVPLSDPYADISSGHGTSTYHTSH